MKKNHSKISKLLILLLIASTVVMTGCQSGGSGGGTGGGGRNPKQPVLNNPQMSIMSIDQDNKDKTVIVTVGISTASKAAIDICGYQFALSYNNTKLEQPHIVNSDDTEFAVLCGDDSKNAGLVRVMGVHTNQKDTTHIDANASRTLVQVAFRIINRKSGTASFQIKNSTAFPAIVSIYNNGKPVDLPKLDLGDAKSINIKK